MYQLTMGVHPRKYEQQLAGHQVDVRLGNILRRSPEGQVKWVFLH